MWKRGRDSLPESNRAAPWETPAAASSGARRTPALRADEGLFTASAANALPVKALSRKRSIMAGDRIAQAMARIDAAAGRIESAAGKPASSPGAGDAELARKYESLRHQAQAALAELDQVIGALDR